MERGPGRAGRGGGGWRSRHRYTADGDGDGETGDERPKLEGAGQALYRQTSFDSRGKEASLAEMALIHEFGMRRAPEHRLWEKEPLTAREREKERGWKQRQM